MAQIIFTATFAVIVLITTYMSIVVVKNNLSIKEKTSKTKGKRHRHSSPVFTKVPSHPKDEREKTVDRLCKRKQLSPAELQYIYDFIMDTGKEKWRYVEGYEGYYRISSEGMVESTRYSKKYLNPGIDNKGRYSVGLTVNGKFDRRYVHRLVAEAFIPNPNRNKTVAAKDGNFLHCGVRNLEWKKPKVAVASCGK